MHKLGRSFGVGVGIVMALAAAAPVAAAVPANDTVAGAIAIADAGFGPRYQALDVDVSGATASATDPTPSCAPTATARSVWWKVTPASDRSLFARAGTNCSPAVVTVFTGAPGALVEVACLQGWQTFAATGGTTYTIMVTQGTPIQTRLDVTITREGPEFVPLAFHASAGKVAAKSRTGASVGLIGTRMCNQDLVMDISGELRQTVGGTTVSGLFSAQVACWDGLGMWGAKVIATAGTFAAGTATVDAQVCARAPFDFGARDCGGRIHATISIQG